MKPVHDSLYCYTNKVTKNSKGDRFGTVALVTPFPITLEFLALQLSLDVYRHVVAQRIRNRTALLSLLGSFFKTRLV